MADERRHRDELPFVSFTDLVKPKQGGKPFGDVGEVKPSRNAQRARNLMIPSGTNPPGRRKAPYREIPSSNGDIGALSNTDFNARSIMNGTFGISAA